MRDTMGKRVAPDKDEKVKGQKAIESEEDGGKHRETAMAHVSTCEDCMATVMAHAGKGKPADGMKAQDQGGKAGNPAKGHDSEKAGANYGRRRH